MTPTIQCFDDHSTQMPNASILYGNSLFFQESQTPASDRSLTRDVRTNHQCTPNLRNRLPTHKRKRIDAYAPAYKSDIKKLLDDSSEETVSEAHLNMIRKRQALLLVTIQTMTLFHNNQILEHKLSALHKKIIEIQNERKKSESKSE